MSIVYTAAIERWPEQASLPWLGGVSLNRAVGSILGKVHGVDVYLLDWDPGQEVYQAWGYLPKRFTILVDGALVEQDWIIPDDDIIRAAERYDCRDHEIYAIRGDDVIKVTWDKAIYGRWRNDGSWERTYRYGDDLSREALPPYGWVLIDEDPQQDTSRITWYPSKRAADYELDRMAQSLSKSVESDGVLRYALKGAEPAYAYVMECE